MLVATEAVQGRCAPMSIHVDDAKMANALYKLGKLSEEAFNAGPEIWKTILGTYRADLFLEESLVDFISDYPPIECDVSVIYGEHDPAASWDAALAWKAAATGAFETSSCPGITCLWTKIQHRRRSCTLHLTQAAGFLEFWSLRLNLG